MGLSISASAAIIFIASVIVFGALLGAFNNAQNAVVDAQRFSLDRQEDSLQTHATITGIDLENSTITLVNDGRITLYLSQVEIFINGSLSNDLVANSSVEGIVGTNLLLPMETATIAMNADLNNTSIAVVTSNGFAAYA